MFRSGWPALLLMLPFALVGPAFGQRLSFGVIGGASLTSDFENDFPESVSTPKRYLAGIVLDVGLTSRFSLEADGLYHPLGYESIDVGGITSGPSPATVLTWIVPVLAKYSLTRKSLWKPFVELGPSFRAAGNVNLADPSHEGVTAGLGVSVGVWRLKVAPVIRYTHWKSDPPALATTIQNQAELLVALTF